MKNSRSGVDSCMPDNVAKQSAILASSEAEKMGLSHTEAGLFARRSFRDGDVIGSVSMMWYASRLTLLNAMEADPGFFTGQAYQVEGLRSAGEGDQTLFGLAVGVFRGLRHYKDSRVIEASSATPRPNVCFRVDPAAGLCDDLVQVVASSRTKCGITSGKQILADFGNNWNDTEAKRRRLEGQIEHYFGGGRQAKLQAAVDLAEAEATAEAKLRKTGEDQARALEEKQKADEEERKKRKRKRSNGGWMKKGRGRRKRKGSERAQTLEPTPLSLKRASGMGGVRSCGKGTPMTLLPSCTTTGASFSSATPKKE